MGAAISRRDTGLVFKNGENVRMTNLAKAKATFSETRGSVQPVERMPRKGTGIERKRWNSRHFGHVAAQCPSLYSVEGWQQN